MSGQGDAHMSHQDYDLLEKFFFTLEWLLAVTKRYTGQIRFSLVHIDFVNPRVLGDTYGAQVASKKLDEALHCLSKSFRKTDLVARDGFDFWVLVPYTATDGGLAEKVSSIIHIASQSGLQIVERDISIFSLPFEAQKLDENCSAAEFLAHLKKNHFAIASHEISLPPGSNLSAIAGSRDL